MNCKGYFFCAVLLAASTIFADTLLDVVPGTILQDKWNKALHKTFSSGSSRTGVDAVSEKGMTIAHYAPGTSSFYLLENAESCGTDNLTFTVLLRARGILGDAYPLYAGAGSHTKPGLRLGLRAKKGTLQAYALFVAASTKEKDKKFVSVQMNPEIRIEQGKWTVLTLSANRSGKLSLFIDGELAGSKSIKQFEKEKLYQKTPLFGTFIHNNPGVENPLSIDVAELRIRNELMSSSEILREADDLLEKVGK